ncbi:MAG: 50S ribosomal protein L11 methyltransferase, partial [Gammaproteobacteria bacterium]
MSWRQLIFQIEAQHAEHLAELLSEAGALAVTLRDAQDEAIYEPAPDTTPLWTRTEVTALFEADADLKQVLCGIKDVLPPYRIETLAEQDWVRRVQQDIKPLCFGGRLWICPGNTTPDAGGVHVVLDPGLAFGTG